MITIIAQQRVIKYSSLAKGNFFVLSGLPHLYRKVTDKESIRISGDLVGSDLGLGLVPFDKDDMIVPVLISSAVVNIKVQYC